MCSRARSNRKGDTEAAHTWCARGYLRCDVWETASPPAKVHPITVPDTCKPLSLTGMHEQGWEAANFSQRWAREAGLDARGVHFAREVRTQLARMMVADAAPAKLPQGSASSAKAIAEGRLETEGPAAAGAKRKREAHAGACGS